MNRAGRALVGAGESDDLSSTTLLSYQPKSVHALVRFEGVPMAMLQGSWQGESALQAARGREIPVSQIILSHKSPDGRIEFLSTIIRDITDQRAEAKIKASLEEKEVLLKEIHHRVKNNMQIVSSLLQLQSTYVQDPPTRRIFDESCNRIKSMALIHEALPEPQFRAGGFPGVSPQPRDDGLLRASREPSAHRVAVPCGSDFIQH